MADEAHGAPDVCRLILQLKPRRAAMDGGEHRVAAIEERRHPALEARLERLLSARDPIAAHHPHDAEAVRCAWRQDLERERHAIFPAVDDIGSPRVPGGAVVLSCRCGERHEPHAQDGPGYHSSILILSRGTPISPSSFGISSTIAAGPQTKQSVSGS